MEIKVENLGVITEGKIELKKNVVNIKYGINGSGKSTISKGIELSVKGEDLNKLRTYGSEIEPTVSISEDISSVIVFNQDYVDDYLFKDDLANNSFEIMINTDEYKFGKKKIDTMFVDLIASINNTNTKTIIEELEALKINVPIEKKKTKANGIQYIMRGTSKFVKARKLADLDELLDEQAMKYKERLESNNNHMWLKWFQAGKDFIEENQKCPFCLNDLPTDFIDTSESIKNSVNATGLKQNIEIKEVISKTEKYMTEENIDIMNSVINNNEDLSEQELKKIYEIITVCDIELTKLCNLRSINISGVKKKYENNTLIDFLKSNILNPNFFEKLSDEVKADVENINEAISKIMAKSKELESITKDFSDKLNLLVKSKKEYINNFLSISGIPYLIDIVESDDAKFKTVLNPLNSSELITQKSLSFGEKNAISLMLFSLEASKDYDLIILDDPVSSFDNNKKFAILYYLFTKEDAVFENKSILLFTHDFDIIVDFIYKDEFKKVENKCYFVKNTGGNLVEKKIAKDSVSYTIRHWRKNAEKESLHPLLRIVNLRKYLQYTQPSETEAINILSSLEHNDVKPMEKISGKKQEIANKIKLDKGMICIKERIKDFDYDTYLLRIQNKDELKKLYDSTDSSISKLQILRMIVNLTGRKVENQVFWDYLTEYYHVENNEMTSLDEKKFDVVPNYIMKMSDEIIGEIFK